MKKSHKHKISDVHAQTIVKKNEVLKTLLVSGKHWSSTLRKSAKKILVPSISLSILGILVSIWLSHNNDAKNNEIHQQASEQIDTRSYQIIDSLSLKTLFLEQQLSEIKAVVIKSNLGIHKAWADSLFLVAETLMPISLKDAESIYTEVLSTAPCAEAYCNRAIIRRILLEPAKALDDYAKALELAPENVMILRNRGLCLVAIGDYGPAEEDYRKAIALDPDFIEPYRCLSILYYKKGLYRKALDILNDPHIKESHNLMFLATRCEISIRCGNYNQANQDAHTLLQLRPDIPLGYIGLGELHIQLRDYKSSIAEYSRGIENSDITNYWTATLYEKRAQAYEIIGSYDKSINDYLHFLEMFPNNTNTLCTIGNIYLKRSQYDKALEYFDKALIVDPNIKCIDERLEICILTQKADSALCYCRHLAELYPQEPVIPFWTAVLQFTLDNKAECMKILRETVELNPGYIKSYLLMAEIYLSELSWQEAIETYSKILQLSPNFAPIYYNRGNCYANLKDLAHAFIDYSIAIELNPQDSFSYINRALCCKVIGDQEQAKQDLETAFKLEPSVQHKMRGFIIFYPCTDLKKIHKYSPDRCP